MNPRRDRFRQAMSRFEPTANPSVALKDGLYVEQPGQSIAARVFSVLELRPGASHLVAGPSGAGKTMQLRVLERMLRDHDELTPIFVDATFRTDDLKQPGKLIEHIAKEVDRLNFKSQAGDASGLSLLMTAMLYAIIKGQAGPDLKKEVAAARQKPVLLLDSLDRLPFETFREIYSVDLSKLQQHMAIVVVGPADVMYGAAREIVDRFDYFLRQPTYDPRRGSTMHRFLTAILRQRADAGLIPDESCALLVEASGGILRDLIALAQLALEEAYVTGHTLVEADDVKRAIDAFGRKHIVGLDSRELDSLLHLHRTGAFVRINDGDTSLLITRRVLEYADERGTPHFDIHPTLVPLLDQMEGP
jgi:Cdc6-like AAA superfamily ATPase